jgi:hypothetical protein
MSLRRGLYCSVRSCEVGVALSKREEARTPKRLALKSTASCGKRAERNAKCAWERPTPDSATLERVIPCAV